MKDYFISYTTADLDWAKVIASALEAVGHSVIYAARDFVPGSNFMLEMHRALEETKQTLALLSKDYLNSKYGQMEWTNSLASGRLIPVKVLPCEPGGLLTCPIWIDLVGLPEAEAGKRLLRQLQGHDAPKAQLPAPRGGAISDERAANPRRDVLWRLAYAFLRLDQLPSGGWSKSLPGWLDALLEGPDDIVISAETRTKGGTDLTSRAFLTYLRFLRRVNFDKPRWGEPPAKVQIAWAVRKNIADKIGWDGGVGVGKPGRVAHHIRHSLMGLLTFLYVGECTGSFPKKEISDVEKYLLNNLTQWKIDRSHPFACFAILAKIREKLAEVDLAGQWNPEALILAIDRVLPEMSGLLCDWEAFDLVPHGTCQQPANVFRFQPYQGFWRMERSNLLMYLPLLTTENGEKFNFENRRLLANIALELESIVGDLAPLPDGTQGRYVYYHRDSSVAGNRPLDFGLTAELLSVLSLPAIRGLVKFSQGDLASICDGLEAALIRGVGRYHDWPIFKFTHSVSLGQYLEVVGKDFIRVESIRQLDDRIDRAIKGAVTEYELDRLFKWIVGEVFGNQPGDHELLVPDLRDMLVTKLASGEHVPKDGDAHSVLEYAPTLDNWRDKVDRALSTTIAFFDGPGGVEYAKRYERSPVEDYVTEVCKLVPDNKTRVRKVLDMGCGPGQYAELLKNRGFDVELADASIQMLRRAHERVYKDVPSNGELKLRRIENLASEFVDCSETFDIIFASAMMIHVPRRKAAEVYRQFHRLIRPGGALFVNFKIGDHTLIGVGEKYNEFYRDHRVPWRMLEEAGFVVSEISITLNRETMYRDPMRIHWANFFCRRPEVASPKAAWVW